METHEELAEIHDILKESLRRIRAIERAYVSPTINHGTKWGYDKHLKEKIPPCDACREANTAHQREKRERKKATDDLL